MRSRRKPDFRRFNFYIHSIGVIRYKIPIELFLAYKSEKNNWKGFNRYSRLTMVKKYDGRFKHFDYKTRKHRVILNDMNGQKFLNCFRWIHENVENKWSLTTLMTLTDNYTYNLEFSFSDLETATLFRLKF